MIGPELSALAAEAGLHERWEDVHGDMRQVSAETLKAVLAAMQWPAGDEAEARASRQRLSRSEAVRDFLVLDQGEMLDVAAFGEGAAELRLEDGEVQTLHPGRPQPLTILGYHQLDLGQRRIGLAVCPPRAFTVADAAPGKRLWGAAAQLYSLRETPGSDFGDFAALSEAATALGAAGASALAVSPVHALFAADPARYSPYGPSSRLFLNVLYGDAGATAQSGDVQAGAAELIDWPEAGGHRMKALRLAFEAFQREGASHHEAFDRFRREGGADLERHALFEALHGRFFTTTGARGWPDWPAEFHDVAGDAATAFAERHADEVTFHVFLQWLADRGLAGAQAAARASGMTLGLITDVAVGMDPGGSHAWSRPQDLLGGVNVGAPPDAFQARGQDWGVTAFSPAALAQTGYAGFLATLRSAMRHAGGVRIDHILGLRRLWLVPHGAPPTEGVYLSYPLDDLLRLIALESWRERAVVIGEDLGNVPRGFRKELRRRGVMGMGVLLFERDEDGAFRAPEAWPREACALTTTHDLPPIAGWWRERDIDVREAIEPDLLAADVSALREERANDRARLWTAARRAGCADGPEPATDAPQAAVEAAVAYVAETACDLALVPLEDLLGQEAQVNVPGTVDEQPNWRRRLAGPLHRLLDAAPVRSRLEALNTRRR